MLKKLDGQANQSQWIQPEAKSDLKKGEVISQTSTSQPIGFNTTSKNQVRQLPEHHFDHQVSFSDMFSGIAKLAVAFVAPSSSLSAISAAENSEITKSVKALDKRAQQRATEFQVKQPDKDVEVDLEDEIQYI